MKTQLIMLDTPIIVSDEKIKEEWRGLAYKSDVKGKVFKHFYTTNPWYNDAKKIIAGIEGLPSIDWNGLEEEFGWIDVSVRDITLEAFKQGITFSHHQFSDDAYNRFRTWFSQNKKVQFLNDKKFSLEDMKNLFAKTLENAPTTETHTRMISDEQYRHHVMDELFNHLIKLLQQPKVFDIEIDGDWNKEFYNLDNKFTPSKWSPKITNNSIKILKKL